MSAQAQFLFYNQDYYNNRYLKCIILVFTIQFISADSFVFHRLRPGCELLTNKDWGTPQPLILNRELSEIIHPETEDSVFLSPIEEIILACPGSKLLLNNETTAVMKTEATCSRGTEINVGKNNYYFKLASCEKLPKTSYKRNGYCFNNTHSIIKVNIGFIVEDNFIELLTVCFDNTTLSAIYSTYTATYKIIGRQHSFPRIQFDAGNFYRGIKVWNLYKREVQRETVGEILGSVELANQYIRDDNSHYLARGHLTAKADFIYGAEQMGTFYYINAAPQWQIINGGNWNALEDSVRTYVINNKLNISVYTLPFGVAVLPDINENLQELYLYKDNNATGNNTYLIPVPKFYIKILFDEGESKGISFITINNPYLEEITPDYILCPDICDRYKWLTWDQDDIEKGYSYCCSYSELLTVLENSPELKKYGYIPKLNITSDL